MDFDGFCAGNLSRNSRKDRLHTQPRECKPQAATARDKTTLSMTIWPTILARRAPRAARMANSFSRPAARASSRLATLAQAISSTNPTVQQYQQGAAYVSHQHLFERDNTGPKALVEFGVEFAEIFLYCAHIGFRLRNGCPRLEAGNRNESMCPPVIDDERIGLLERRTDVHDTPRLIPGGKTPTIV